MNHDQIVLRVNETSLSRALDSFNSEELAMLTSWRVDKSREDNVKSLNTLKSDIKAMGLGFISTKASGQETVDNKTVNVSEDSLLIINRSRQDREPIKGFKHKMLELANRYGQNYILYGNKGLGQLLSVSGNVEETYQTFKQGTSKYYTQLRGRHAFHLESLTRSYRGIQVEGVFASMGARAAGEIVDMSDYGIGRDLCH